jgi:hypothetical protein
MPYNPGVQDMRGQIWSQGIGQFAHGIARGVEEHGRRQEENKALTSQAKALETLLPLYAQKAGVNPEEIEQFLSPSPDESPRGRVARLSSAIEGIVGNAALQSRQLNDEMMRTNTAATRQNMDLGREAAPGVRAHTAAQTEHLQAEIERLLRPEQQPFRPEMIDLGNGVSAMMTSPKSAVPIAKGPGKPEPGAGGIKTIEIPGVGTIVVDAQTGVPLANNRISRPAAGGQKIDPLMMGTLTEQIAKLEAEKLEHQREMVQGDKRTGFLNTQSRDARVKAIDQQLTGLRATLVAGGKGTAAAPASEGAPPAKSKPLASPYSSADVQAELRRRGLIANEDKAAAPKS